VILMAILTCKTERAPKNGPAVLDSPEGCPAGASEAKSTSCDFRFQNRLARSRLLVATIPQKARTASFLKQAGTTNAVGCHYSWSSLLVAAISIIGFEQ